MLDFVLMLAKGVGEVAKSSNQKGCYITLQCSHTFGHVVLYVCICIMCIYVCV